MLGKCFWLGGSEGCAHQNTCTRPDANLRIQTQSLHQSWLFQHAHPDSMLCALPIPTITAATNNSPNLSFPSRTLRRQSRERLVQSQCCSQAASDLLDHCIGEISRRNNTARDSATYRWSSLDEHTASTTKCGRPCIRSTIRRSKSERPVTDSQTSSARFVCICDGLFPFLVPSAREVHIVASHASHTPHSWQATRVTWMRL